MRRISKRIKQTVILLLMLMLLPGCGAENRTRRDATTVFQFQGQNISLGEVFLYIETIREDYERRYGTEIWSMQVSVGDKTMNMGSLTKQDVIEDIVRVKVLAGQAAGMGLLLSEDEAERVDLETSAFWKNLTDEQINTMELSKEMVKSCLTENMLANKVYDQIIREAGIEISDEDARITTIYDMYFPIYRESANGTLSPMDEQEKEEQYKRAVQAYNMLITPVSDGVERNVEALAAYYGLNDAEYVTKTPREIKAIYGKDIAEMLYTLEDGSYSLVTETEYGYHIFYMQALTDRTATDRKKAQMKREKENQYFNTKYLVWLRTADANFRYEDSVDFEVYDQIQF